MRTTICNLVLVSKYENGHMKISISSRQVRARKIILNLNLNLEKLNLLSRMRVRLHLQQSYFEAPSVCFMKNLSKNRERVPIVNKTKASIFGFHLPSTISRVMNIKIGNSWWKARGAKTRQHCRLTICMKLVELTNSDSTR